MTPADPEFFWLKFKLPASRSLTCGTQEDQDQGKLDSEKLIHRHLSVCTLV
jgi:hypothetical protein